MNKLMHVYLFTRKSAVPTPNIEYILKMAPKSDFEEILILEPARS